MLLIAVLIVSSTVFLALTMRHRWSWAEPVASRWERIRPWMWAYVRLSPATFVYLLVLVVTTWVLRSSTVTLGQALLFEHSTNLTQLANDPVSVLVTSAAWLTRRELLLWLVLFPLVLAPAERWLGSLRTIVVFAIGHVGATLMTAAGIAYGIDHGLLPDHLRNVVDVGSSYGFLCVAALFTYRLPGRWRWLWAGTLLGGALVVAAVDSSFSDYGHLVAVIIGLSLYGVTRTPAEQIRSLWPIWRPPEELVEAERERYSTRDRLQHGR